MADKKNIFTTQTSNIDDSKRDQWFDDLIAKLRTDQLQLETNTASNDKVVMYESLMNGNQVESMFKVKLESDKFFVRSMVVDFVKQLNFDLIDKLAFSFEFPEVLAWIQIKDSNSEKAIIMSEAKTNAKYHSKGYDINSIIISPEDKLPVPNHYFQLI